MGKTVVSGAFDNISSRDIRLLQEVSREAPLHMLLWSDNAITKLTGAPPKFPLPERQYYMDAVRFVDSIEVVDTVVEASILPVTSDVDTWVVSEKDHSPEKARFCKIKEINYKVIPETQLDGFPLLAENKINRTDTKKIIVTGCYDWLHTGHIRFFEEVSELGDLYVGLGNDANIEQLKGEGHPLFKEDERRYMVQSIKFVTEALINRGDGLLDVVPELERIKPDIYAVNEDGHTEGKRQLCKDHNMEYVLLKRTPAPGLQRRESTALRGF